MLPGFFAGAAEWPCENHLKICLDPDLTLYCVVNLHNQEIPLFGRMTGHLRLIQFMKCSGEKLDCIVHQRCLCLIIRREVN